MVQNYLVKKIVIYKMTQMRRVASNEKSGLVG